MSEAPQAIRPPMVPLIRQFAAAAGRSVEDITGPARTKDLVDLRRSLIRELFEEGYAASAIARRVNRNHTTVLYHCGRIPKSKGLALSRLERPAKAVGPVTEP